MNFPQVDVPAGTLAMFPPSPSQMLESFGQKAIGYWNFFPNPISLLTNLCIFKVGVGNNFCLSRALGVPYRHEEKQQSINQTGSLSFLCFPCQMNDNFMEITQNSIN